MSMIFGLFSPAGKPPPPAWLAAMEARAARWPADHVGQHASGGSHIAIRERSRFAGAPAGGFALDRGSGHAVVLDGRIDNRAELLATLGMAEASDAELVLAAHRHWGADFAAHLIGDFALAIVHSGGHGLELARDAMGVRPLFHASGEGWTAFASSMDVLLALPFVDRAPNMVWLGDFLESIKADGSSTPYRGISALPRAMHLSIRPQGQTMQRFWNPPALDDVLDIDEHEAVSEFRRLFDQAIACRLPERGTTAFELSGGLDSTSITVSAAPMLSARGDQMLTLSHVLGKHTPNEVGLRDERVQMNAVLETLPPGIHRWLDESHARQLDAMADTIARHGGPERRDFNSVQHGLAEALAEHDCRVLLSGFGGDDLATSLGAGLTESLARDGKWGEIDRIVHNPLARLAWRNPLGRRLLRWRVERQAKAGVRSAPRITRSEYLSDADLALRRLAFPLRTCWGSIGEREREVIILPSLGFRGQDSAVGAGTLGFDYAYPMLDLRLVEFVLRLPDHLKCDVDGRRMMIRRAMEGRLPDIVRLRDDKAPAAVPVAVAQFHAELDSFAGLMARHSDNPLLATLVDMDSVLRELRVMGERKQLKGDFSARHFRAIAQLCLWSQWLSENPPLAQDQPNHAE